ncbi:hypothetical protein E3T55_18035 [Cryobacterium frigoriphilum]|uniref:Uncharacterized protein n=1 Tax=Cryobacterium frigoriphilum TaxID=1259150 RepID=A0A4R8ZU08_9MICO|nr:hypothetical protein E3T55_18035 [Cryobacterium frigoriphilum]
MTAPNTGSRYGDYRSAHPYRAHSQPHRRAAAPPHRRTNAPPRRRTALSRRESGRRTPSWRSTR